MAGRAPAPGGPGYSQKSIVIRRDRPLESRGFVHYFFVWEQVLILSPI
jgi:hypothetical protein